MQFVSVLSTATETDHALAELCATAAHRLRGVSPDLVLAFATPHHLHTPEGAATLSAVLREHFPTALVLATTAAGVVADGREVEHHAAIALTAAVLPGVELRAFHLERDEVPMYSGREAARRWRNLLLPAEAEADPALPQPPVPDDPVVLLLPDPLCPGLPELVAGVDAAWPEGTVVGGLVSGGFEEGDCPLILDDEVHLSGVLGLVLYGDLEVAARVAQGCRPVGQPLFVTRGGGARLGTLDGRPAVDVLKETYEGESEEAREHMRQALFIGLGVGRRESYGPGHFLVRNLMGAEAETGVLLVHGEVREGEVVQFQVRDARCAEDELRRHLETVPGDWAGGLVFACHGRGQDLYEVPNHDIEAITEALGPIPVGGCFSSGEIGPVDGATFLHSRAATLCFFRPRRSPVS